MRTDLFSPSHACCTHESGADRIHQRPKEFNPSENEEQDCLACKISTASRATWNNPHTAIACVRYSVHELTWISYRPPSNLPVAMKMIIWMSWAAGKATLAFPTTSATTSSQAVIQETRDVHLGGHMEAAQKYSEPTQQSVVSDESDRRDREEKRDGGGAHLWSAHPKSNMHRVR